MAFMMRTLAAAAGTLMLVGCTTSQPEFHLPGDHPANPKATESASPNASATLDARPSFPTPQADGAAEGTDRGGGMKPGMTGMAGMNHGGATMPAMSGMPGMHHHDDTIATSGMQHDMPGMAAAPASTPGTKPATSPATAPAAYACPMHAQVTAAGPGKCPICHMTLVANKQAGPPDHAGHGGQP